jgi:uncharacterized protein (TIGR00299 family) protein
MHLHFDCASGCAGDMMLGALLDLGVPDQCVRDAIDKMGIESSRLSVESVVKGGIAASNVTVDASVGEHDHSHDHDHDHSHNHDNHHHHHAYGEIRERLVTLEDGLRERAIDIFDRVARAEAKLHGSTLEEVQLHEVGGIDSIIDIVGTAAAFEWLQPAGVSSSPVATGHGTVKCAHGMLPVPAPATVEILVEAGALSVDGGVARELCTPTGAAILASVVTRWEPMPMLTMKAVGHGAGDIELADRPNVLRVIAGKPAVIANDEVYELAANVDDMSPEMCEHAATRMFEAGALDVWWTPITMKKSRPALELRALVPASALDEVVESALRNTTSIGLRYHRAQRRVLERDYVEVATEYGTLVVKVARLSGSVVNVAPEFESCRAAADQRDVPLKEVYAAASAAFRARKDES